MYLKGFEDFLAENLNVPVYREFSEFLNACIQDAKKRGIVSKISPNLYARQTLSLGSQFVKMYPAWQLEANGKIFCVGYEEDSAVDVGTRGFVLSDESYEETEKFVKEIFPEDATGGSKEKGKIFSKKFLRASVEMFGVGSKQSFSCKVHPDYTWDKDASNLDKIFNKVAVVNYTIESTEQEKMSYQQILDLPACKEFLKNTGTELISNPRALKNNTLTFAFPTAAAISEDPEGDEWHWLAKNRDGKEQPYLLNATALFSSGYVRVVGAWNPGYDFRSQVRGKFDSSTIQGWEKAFEMMNEIWEKWRKKWEKRGIKLLITPEERHQKRGSIVGKKFGF